MITSSKKNDSDGATEDEADDETIAVEITASVKDFSRAGLLQIAYDPPYAKVPDNWELIWGADILATLSAEERKVFSTKAKDLINIEFLQESEETLNNFEWSLENLSSHGFEIQFAFPNPLLISSGDLLDSV